MGCQAGVREAVAQNALRHTTLSLQGLNHFRNSVLFLDVHPDDEADHMRTIANTLRYNFPHYHGTRFLHCRFAQGT